MKKFLYLLLLSGCALTLFAKHDGWYVNTLTKNYPTPHLTWAKDFPKAKVLLIFPRNEGRHAAELIQRYPMEETVFVIYDFQKIANDGVYDAALSGTGSYEKAAEIREKIQQKYQAMVLVNTPFEKLPPDVQFQLLQQVREGTGLLLINTKLPYSRPLSQTLPTPKFDAESVHPATGIRTFQFGKGRICSLKHTRNGMVPPIFPDRHWAARYENAQMTLCRALAWVIRGDAPVSLTVKKAENVLHFPDGVQNLEYRIRDEYNRIRLQGKAAAARLELPALPNGSFFCDLLLPGQSFSTTEFTVDSPAGKITLTTDTDAVAPGKPITGTFALEKPLSGTAKLELSLSDFPHGRIWKKQTVTLPAGKNSVSFTMTDYFMPDAAGYLHAELHSASGAPVGYAEKELYFPVPYPEDGYVQFAWGGPTDPLMAARTGDHLGFNAALSHYKVALDNARQYTLLNQRLVSYLTRINIRSGQKGEVNYTKLFYPDGMKALAKLGSDHSFYRPEVQQIWRDYVRYRMEGLPRFKPFLYSLGDENGNTLSAGFGPSDLHSFRAFLKRKYGTIEKLNREWNGAWKSFDEVPHRPLAVTEKENNAPEWNDHYEYMERMFADLHHLCAEEIRKLDPDAKVGLEGTFGNHNIEQMMEKLDWWGPYSNLLEDELIRSLYPANPRFIWIGYHKERAMKYPLTLQDALLKGVVNGNAWYALSPFDSSHGITAIDDSDSYNETYSGEFRRLRFGTAQQLIHTPLAQSGVGIFWNHVSKRAFKADPRCSAPETSIAPLLRYAYRTGVNFEFVTARTLDRLKEIRVLFLCGISAISEAESAAILEFVKNGGTVIADLYPGVLNENLRKQTSNPLRELFGDLLLKDQAPNLVKALQTPRMKASHALVNPAGPYLAAKKFGKGSALLLNFSFAVIETSAAPETPFDSFVTQLLNDGGITIPYRVDTPAVLRVRQGDGYQLFGVMAKEDEKPYTLSLPKPLWVYECGTGLASAEPTAALTIKPGNSPLKLFAAFPEKQPSPELSLPATAHPGERLEISLQSIPAGHFSVLRVFDPAGNEWSDLAQVVKVRSGSKLSFTFPCNAAKGTCRFHFQDFTTGLAVEKSVNLQ